MNILIYTDNVSTNHLLYYALGRLRGKESIYFANANEILNGALTNKIDLFVMPGGASRYKAAKLNGAANRAIKQYVENGGRYLGICAGAYMACELTEWAKDKPHEIITRNELAFFPGSAVGPIEAFGRGDNYNQTDARLVTLEWDGKPVTSLYLGGCVFQPSTTEGYQILATFSELPEKPAAVVCGDYGKGRWLLSSTHPEYDDEAIELVQFDVIGNDYKDFARLPADRPLSLNLLDQQLITLFA